MAVKKYSIVSTTDQGVLSHIDHEGHESADWPSQWCKSADVEALEQEVERLKGEIFPAFSAGFTIGYGSHIKDIDNVADIYATYLAHKQGEG